MRRRSPSYRWAAAVGDLISFADAKDQLRHTTSVDDLHVQRTITIASAIIRDYLKSRADRRFTILSSSVASPTVITTVGAHGYTTGESVRIASHLGSTPTLSGLYTLTAIDETTFSIPAAVTVAGAGGSATVEWDEETVPGQIKQACFLMFVHLYEHRGDDMSPDGDAWEAIARLLARSRDPAYA
jgi:hypothetical protein